MQMQRIESAEFNLASNPNSYSDSYKTDVFVMVRVIAVRLL